MSDEDCSSIYKTVSISLIDFFLSGWTTFFLYLTTVVSKLDSWEFLGAVRFLSFV